MKHLNIVDNMTRGVKTWWGRDSKRNRHGVHDSYLKSVGVFLAKRFVLLGEKPLSLQRSAAHLKNKTGNKWKIKSNWRLYTRNTLNVWQTQLEWFGTMWESMPRFLGISILKRRTKGSKWGYGISLVTSLKDEGWCY